ncbi:MAG: DUF4988 and DUF4465 domain-containing protein [Paramuribaculum sp.]|nr:DUF4988 and DUF4465 domain-containing protein [Paramuribaculum sp.]
MRKSIIILSLAAALFIPSACSYDDSDLWNAVNGIEDRVETLETASAQMNTDIKSLQSILQAIQNNISITAITPTENGYTIKFSNGTEATISNGIDGASAPEISVRKDDDGMYYWTIAGEWLIVDGEKVRATALDGADAVAPQMRINPETGIWEISTDGGNVWTSTGVVANGDKGDSLFAKVDVSNSEYVEFTLADGSTFRVQRYNSSAPLFSVEDAEGLQIIRCGESKSFKVETANVASFSISKPDGWRASFADNTLTITAPVEANQYAEQEGVVDITVVSTAGTSMIVRIQVATFERRVLTFEDADVKFKPFTLEYCNKKITNWSDLIDSKQYGGPMLYGDSGYGMDQPYEWYDEENTELKHTMVEGYGQFCYWNGGHAISNYVSTNLAEGDFSHQLAVYGTSGHNGSANFAVHDGYRDESAYKKDATLPSIEFGDGKEHVVESMWVMNTLYAMNCYLNGNGLTAEIGPDDWVMLVATGYNSKGDKVGETTFYTCKGPDNIVRDWTKWDLSVLGKVAKIEFNVTGSSDNGSGFSQPAYFAYDDVTVQI